MVEGKRTYRSALREEQARRTRAAVITAAAACFLDHGYAATTMKEIAATAGVSLQTVFAQGSKAALLLAAVDRGVVGDDAEQALIERDALQRLLTSSDKAEKLRILREVAITYVPSSGPIVRVFRAAAAADDELAAAWAEYERRRYTDTRALVASFGPLLRDGLDVERAIDIAWSILTAETADMFMRGRGWSLKEYADWLVDAVDRLLLR